MPHATQLRDEAAPRRSRDAGARPAEPALPAASCSAHGAAHGPALGEDGAETAAEHDWHATLDLVHRVSRQARRTGGAVKAVREGAEGLVPDADQSIDQPDPSGAAGRSVAVLAGIAGIVLSWCALLWFIFAEDPFLGWKASFPAVTRHYLITLAQCALFTALGATIVAVLQRGLGPWARSHAIPPRRPARQDPASPRRSDRRQVGRAGGPDTRP